LQAAAVLKPLPREHDIWLVHLTGEEFPADDLGARRLVESLLSQKQDLTALLLMDMLGYNPRRERKFQLNVGGLFETGAASVRIGQLAQQLTARVAPLHTAQLLGSLDLRNYLYNTDGLVFAENGFPVLFFNEQSNRYTLNRAGYHDTRDTVLGVDADYAATISKVAIATAAVLAQAVTW
jgi:Zn-dependent M28 family amino/carboxypeptidase